MDYKQLRQLRWLPGEIEQISRRLEELPDTPENQGERETEMLRLAQCRKEYAARMAYLEAVPDSYTRQLLFFRYRDGLTYRQIAARVRGTTPDAIRQQCLRFIRKHPDLPEKA